MSMDILLSNNFYFYFYLKLFSGILFFIFVLIIQIHVHITEYAPIKGPKEYEMVTGEFGINSNTHTNKIID